MYLLRYVDIVGRFSELSSPIPRLSRAYLSVSYAFLCKLAPYFSDIIIIIIIIIKYIYIAQIRQKCRRCAKTCRPIGHVKWENLYSVVLNYWYAV